MLVRDEQNKVCVTLTGLRLNDTNEGVEIRGRNIIDRVYHQIRPVEGVDAVISAEVDAFDLRAIFDSLHI